MATTHYMATQLRRLDPAGCLGLTDAEVIAIANACDCCGEPIADDETLAEFAAASETISDFYDKIIFHYPRKKRIQNERPYEGSEFDG